MESDGFYSNLNASQTNLALGIWTESYICVLLDVEYKLRESDFGSVWTERHSCPIKYQ